MANARWQTVESGILRKKEERTEELFVFGYSCKIFNDYEKALYIDQGKHLIPWMGDETLKIDRYDCRGAISDLTPYVANSNNYDPWMGLTAEERKREELCDKERYRFLNCNEEEDSLYQEEELKRLHQALNSEKTYSEVGYNYASSKINDNESSLQLTNDGVDENEPFVPSFQMDIPQGMKLPETKKQHGIIEKTALFINQQGPQMEVLLKIKQADNPQFKFLSFDNELYPYYRYLLMAVKNKHYKPESLSTTKGEQTGETGREEYLHPALNTGQCEVNAESAPTIPAINYKPSADCSYSALVNRIKETSVSSLLEDIKKNARRSESRSPNGDRSPVSDSASSTSSRSTSVGSSSSIRSKSKSEEKSLIPSPSSNTQSIDNEESQYSSTPPASTLSVPLSALSKSARRRFIRKAKQRAAAESYKIYYVEEPAPVVQDVPVAKEKEELIKAENVKDEESTDHRLPAESDETSEETNVIPQKNESPTIVPSIVPAPAAVVYVPPSDVQLIIDKMASYVAKNGRDFEDIVRNKGDPRFSFLEPNHMYNPYYNQKVELYLQLDLSDAASSVSTKTVSSLNMELTSLAKEPNESGANAITVPTKKIIKSNKLHKPKPMPICFSIKKPRDQETLEARSALPDEETWSTGSNEDSEADNKSLKNEYLKEAAAAMIPTPVVAPLNSEQSNGKIETNNGKGVDMFENTEPKQLQPDTTKKPPLMSPESWAKERLKAKLVMTAKGKIAAKEKDKQLQAERRKKATQFITLLQKENMMGNLNLSVAASLMGDAEVTLIKDKAKSASEVISISSSSSGNSDSDVEVVKQPNSNNENKSKRKHHGSDKHKKKRKYSDDKDDDEDHSKRKHRSSSASKHKGSRSKRDSDRYRKSHKKKKRHYYKSEDKYRDYHRRNRRGSKDSSTDK